MQDFLYLTEANPWQQVAYAATLLQEAAADWWVALLKERSGCRPDDFAEFMVLLCLVGETAAVLSFPGFVYYILFVVGHS